MYIVAIFIGSHDWNLSILKDGKLVALLQEERFSKIKKDISFPPIFLEKISNFTSLIDYLILAGDDNCENYWEYVLNFLKKKQVKVKTTIITESKLHHTYHAASAFYGSGFKEAMCITIDGYGGYLEIPETRGLKGVYTTTIFQASYPNNFERKYANLFYNPIFFDSWFYDKDVNSFSLEFNSNLDIGKIYDTITEFLGFKDYEAGKVMGLASYGKPNSLIPSIHYKNSIQANSNFLRGDFTVNTTLHPELKSLTSELTQDLAFSVQKALEKTFIYRVNQALSINPSCKNIVFSGGCALNVVGNYIIKKHFPNINFYFDPIGHDGGQSYGAVKFHYYNITNSTKIDPLKNLYWGPSYSQEDLLNSIQKYV